MAAQLSSRWCGGFPPILLSQAQVREADPPSSDTPNLGSTLLLKPAHEDLPRPRTRLPARLPAAEVACIHARSQPHSPALPQTFAARAAARGGRLHLPTLSPPRLAQRPAHTAAVRSWGASLLDASRAWAVVVAVADVSLSRARCFCPRAVLAPPAWRRCGKPCRRSGRKSGKTGQKRARGHRHRASCAASLAPPAWRVGGKGGASQERLVIVSLAAFKESAVRARRSATACDDEARFVRAGGFPRVNLGKRCAA